MPKLKNEKTSRQEDEWATPAYLFEKLDAEFHFGLDVCATAANAKCKRYFDKEQDGLSQDWKSVCFMNHPGEKSLLSGWRRHINRP